MFFEIVLKCNKPHILLAASNSVKFRNISAERMTRSSVVVSVLHKLQSVFVMTRQLMVRGLVLQTGPAISPPSYVPNLNESVRHALSH